MLHRFYTVYTFIQCTILCYDPLVSGCNIKGGSSHKRFQCQLFYLIKLKQQQSVMTIKHTSRDNEENQRHKYNKCQKKQMQKVRKRHSGENVPTECPYS